MAEEDSLTTEDIPSEVILPKEEKLVPPPSTSTTTTIAPTSLVNNPVIEESEAESESPPSLPPKTPIVLNDNVDKITAPKNLIIEEDTSSPPPLETVPDEPLPIIPVMAKKQVRVVSHGGENSMENFVQSTVNRQAPSKLIGEDNSKPSSGRRSRSGSSGFPKDDENAHDQINAPDAFAPESDFRVNNGGIDGNPKNANSATSSLSSVTVALIAVGIVGFIALAGIVTWKKRKASGNKVHSIKKGSDHNPPSLHPNTRRSSIIDIIDEKQLPTPLPCAELSKNSSLSSNLSSSSTFNMDKYYFDQPLYPSLPYPTTSDSPMPGGFEADCTSEFDIPFGSYNRASVYSFSPDDVEVDEAK